MPGPSSFIFNDLQKLRGFGHWIVVASTAILFVLVVTVVDTSGDDICREPGDESKDIVDG
jgi:hypothetical protein